MNLKRFCVLTLFSVYFGAAWADSSDKDVQLGIYSSSIRYEEPSADVVDDGKLVGFIGKLSLHSGDSVALFDISYSSGDMNYEGSGTMTGVPDRIFEMRGMLGKDFFSGGYRYTPYFGLGYRNLNDDSSGRLTSTGYSGYEREQIYLYSPIGLNIKKENALGGWSLGGGVEYDYLLSGTNHTYLSSVSPGYGDLTMEQHDGHGYRVSLNIEKKLSTGDSILIEPFYKYWHIKDSDDSYDSVSGSWYYEPENTSKELGVALLISF